MNEQTSPELETTAQEETAQTSETDMEIIPPSSLPPASMTYSGDSDRSIEDEMETCYLDYAMSVIVSRALPDVRDGLKPVHRRILYAMYDGGLRATGKHRKSARIVGDTMANYHPHGDASIYDAMVIMAQNFSMRYMLVDGQGNFGSMDGDAAAAMRYTEAKMSKIAEMLLADIDKDTVDWADNYDASTQEPKVLPTRVPNLLLNGVMGIAVGMATNIPPHNLGELTQALLFILHHPNPAAITIEDLMDFIKGPDFPTGGIIYNKKDILNAYATGRGSIVLRGRATIDEGRTGRKEIIISEIPYKLNKSEFVKKIAELVQEKIIVGISDLRDESSKDLVRIVIELKKDSFPKKILNQLYKLTPLQSSFAFNMIALGEKWRQPKLFNLLEILTEFLDHRREVIVRRTRFELAVAEARAHILEGLKIALDNIDAVIKIIKESKNKEDAQNNLMTSFGLSERQTTAILEMQLQRLSGLERKKIEDELTEKLLLITDLKDILARPERVNGIIGDEMTEIQDKYADARRTEVQLWWIGEFNPKDTIPNEDVVITLSKNSYVKRVKADAFRTQKRGWRGVTMAVKEEDEVKILVSAKNHDDLVFFTNTGRAFALPAYEVPETQRTAKGQPIVNLLSLQKDEEIEAIMNNVQDTGKQLILVSKKAVVKRIDREEIKNIRSSGLIVMKPKDGDSLGWVCSTEGNDNIVLVSKKGKAIQFNEEDVRVMGRAAAGVRWMKIATTDELVEAVVVGETDQYIFTVTENGMGKITALEEYREQGRGGSGVKVGAVTEKTGDIVGASLLNDAIKAEWEAMLMSRQGQTIRFALKGIRTTSRVTQGVILTKLSDKNDVIIRVAVMGKSEEEEITEDTNTIETEE